MHVGSYPMRLRRAGIFARLAARLCPMASLELGNFNGQRLDGLRFCSMVYDLFEQIRATPEGPSDLRMRRGRENKRLIEELLPICRYVQTRYRHGN